MIIEKHTHTGELELSYTGIVVPADIANCILVDAVFTFKTVTTAYTTFAQGDHLHEYFFGDRYYNIFALYEGNFVQLKGWYCNICRPATWDTERICCQDLKLDLWISAEGDVQILDKDEFDALDLPSAERDACLNAVSGLRAMAQMGTLPK